MPLSTLGLQNRHTQSSQPKTKSPILPRRQRPHLPPHHLPASRHIHRLRTTCRKHRQRRLRPCTQILKDDVERDGGVVVGVVHGGFEDIGAGGFISAGDEVGGIDGMGGGDWEGAG
jgi:hypothetical protein